MFRIFSKYVFPKTLALVFLEGGLIVLALICAVRIQFWDSTPGFSDLYNLRHTQLRNERLMALAQSLGAGCLLLGILYYVFPSLLLGRGVFFISMALVPAFIAVSRVGLDRIW